MSVVPFDRNRPFSRSREGASGSAVNTASRHAALEAALLAAMEENRRLAERARRAEARVEDLTVALILQDLAGDQGARLPRVG